MRKIRWWIGTILMSLLALSAWVILVYVFTEEHILPPGLILFCVVASLVSGMQWYLYIWSKKVAERPDEQRAHDAPVVEPAPATDDVPETASASEAVVGGALFRESDYLPFMNGVFIAGGLIARPLLTLWFSASSDLGYWVLLPYSLVSCVVVMVAFRGNGTISWVRLALAMVGGVAFEYIYSGIIGIQVSLALGIPGLALLMVCGYIGIGIGRLFGRIE